MRGDDVTQDEWIDSLGGDVPKTLDLARFDSPDDWREGDVPEWVRPITISDDELALSGLVRVRAHSHDSRPGSQCLVVAKQRGRGWRQAHISVDGHDPSSHRFIWLSARDYPACADTDAEAIQVARGLLQGTFRPCELLRLSRHMGHHLRP